MVNIGLIQYAPTTDQDNNLTLIIKKINTAAKKGANIICLPELFLTPYFCQSENKANFSYATPIPNDATHQLCLTAKQNNIVIIASFFEKSASKNHYNTAVIINTNGTILGKYRKNRIPEDPGFYEKFYFEPGNLGYPVFDTKFGKIGILICWDQWFPEAARQMALNGAQIIFYPTAIGWLPDEKETVGTTQLHAWKTVQQGHAVANHIYIASVNRTGFEVSSEPHKGIEFWGNSFISGPQGEILAEATQNKEDTLIATIDYSHAADVRKEWPFFRDL